MTADATSRELVQAGIAAYLDRLLVGGWADSGAEAAAHIMRALVDPYANQLAPTQPSEGTLS